MEYELTHHGIKGMKWGVRRFQNKDGSLTNAGKKRRKFTDTKFGSKYKLHDDPEKERQEVEGTPPDKKRNWSDDAKTADALKKKSVHEMSNTELKKFNERTRLEQEYSRLNPSAVKKGYGYVAGAIGVMGTAVTLYNNSNNLVKVGKSIVSKFKK